jgi:hypothetical protein
MRKYRFGFTYWLAALLVVFVVGCGQETVSLPGVVSVTPLQGATGVVAGTTIAPSASSIATREADMGLSGIQPWMRRGGRPYCAERFSNRNSRRALDQRSDTRRQTFRVFIMRVVGWEYVDSDVESFEDPNRMKRVRFESPHG